MLTEFARHFLGGLTLAKLTLGTGFPKAGMALRYLFGKLTLTGPLPLEQVHQSLADASATGEALGDLLDSGGLDISLGL
ncbi:MAG: hypothetical protein R2762_25920 [Bryobacteraceae bacterium]